MTGALAGKKYLILGVANDKSIAWSIAQSLHEQGAELAFTYVNEAIERRVRPLAAELNCERIYACDVQSDESIDTLFQQLGKDWDKLDGVVHAVAFAERDDLQGRFSKTSRAGFKLALDVSAYSLIAVAARAEAMLKETQGSIITLTYLGSDRVIPNYNVMGVAKAALEASVRYLAADLGESGIRVNAISAGPIKTLAASGIPQFRDMLAAFAARAPLKRNVTQDDVAKTARFLLGPDSCGITGEVMFVDVGFNVMGM